MYQRIMGRDGVLPGIRRISDGAVIPDDPDNADWRAYQAWLEEENEPEDPAPLPSARIIVSRLRFKLELQERELLSAVEAAVAGAGALAQLYWAEATQFESDHPLVAQIGTALNLSPETVREIFEGARDRQA